MTTRTTLALLAALLLIGASASWGAGDTTLRFGGALVHPTQDLTIFESESIALGDGTTLTASAQMTIQADDGPAFCVEFEHRLNQRLGVDVVLMRSETDLEMNAEGSLRITDDASGVVLLDEVVRESASEPGRMTPLLVGPNFHFLPNRKFDLYAGPFVGYVLYDTVRVDGENVGIENDFAYGAVAGVDVPFGSGNLAFNASARYMIADAEPKVEDPQALEMDSTILQFGLSYRF